MDEDINNDGLSTDSELEEFDFDNLETKKEEINLKYVQKARTQNRRWFHEKKKNEKSQKKQTKMKTWARRSTIENSSRLSEALSTVK